MTEMSDKLQERVLLKARDLGVDAGRDAAAAGAVMLLLPRVRLHHADPRAGTAPDLSGEWAGSMTPHALWQACMPGEDAADYDELADELCTAWEEGVQEGMER